MKTVGLTLVRNESLTIKEILDRYAEFCSGGIYVFDDCSEDNTAEIALGHESVRKVIQNRRWDSRWHIVQSTYRQAIYEIARPDLKPEDWMVYFDADEIVECDFKEIENPEIDSIVMNLFDFYITPKDEDRAYGGDLTALRDWCGPEFRKIVNMFRAGCEPKWSRGGRVRVPAFKNRMGKTASEGYIRHYGKSISVAQWEETCDHYVRYHPGLSKKWANRKGKAIHSVSDFGKELIAWSDKDQKGVVLKSSDKDIHSDVV